MRKSALFAAPLLAALFAAAPVFAQTDAKPAPSPAPSAAPASEAAVSPQAQVDAFFQMLTEGRVEAAYDELLKGTNISRSPKDVEMLKEKTRAALRVFGDIGGVDLLDTKKVGTHLQRIISLSLNSGLPIRWRFYFYQAQDKWRLIDIRIDDRLQDMFEEPVPMVIPTPTAPAATAAPAPSRAPSRLPAR